jgi:acetyl esterase
MPLHPEAQQLLAALDQAGLPPFEHMTVPQAREAAKGFTDLQGEPEEVDTEDRTVPGPAGDIPVRIYTPGDGGPKPVIMYFHGGGWVIGDLDVCDNPVRRIANRTGAIVVSVMPRPPGSLSTPPSLAATPSASRPAATVPVGTPSLRPTTSSAGLDTERRRRGHWFDPSIAHQHKRPA